ncbi:MAG: xylulokinase, partial [Clostridia bacterium]|nr:xylulokinase [Clostridia bacterium]
VLCGSFIGLRSTHTRAHFTRSVLEGVAFSLLHSREKLIELGIDISDKAILIGGGSKIPLWAQIVSDCLGIKLVLTGSGDSSLGSCMLAGIASGVFKDASDAVKRCVKIVKTVTPNKENTNKYRQLFAEYVRIHDALAPVYKERNQ